MTVYCILYIAQASRTFYVHYCACVVFPLPRVVVCAKRELVFESDLISWFAKRNKLLNCSATGYGPRTTVVLAS